MKRILITAFLIMSTTVPTWALVINEVMSNPTGDDSGREWIEIYNNEESDVDLSTLTISIKGGAPIATTFLSGGAVLSPSRYAIIGSIVSGATRFSQDYPSYSGPLFKSSISLVNSGVTSIEIKLGGVSVNNLSSYTAAKEGSTYSLLGGTWATGIPTPGEDNRPVVVSSDNPPPSTDPPGTQASIPQARPPVSDIIFILPKEKTIVAGAPALFSTYSTNHEGKLIDNISYTWSFGDGGEKTGGTTTYRYFYPGLYIAQVEGSNGSVSGIGRVSVRVVSPDMVVSPLVYGKYGSYIEIRNPSTYDIDISNWKLSIDGAVFPFPKNTLLASGVTRFSGVAMGFASTTVSSSTLIKIIFPNMEEVTRVYQGGDTQPSLGEPIVPKVVPVQEHVKQAPTVPFVKKQPELYRKQVNSSSSISTSSTKIMTRNVKKDNRIATFLKSIF